MRKKLYALFEPTDESDNVKSKYYDWFMMTSILISIIPLAFKTHYPVFDIIEYITVTIFIFDYLLRLLTADFFVWKGKKSFFIYPFTPMAVIDLISILPSIFVINKGLKLLKLFRLFRSFRVFRVFKVIRYSKNIRMILRIFKKSKGPLLTVGGIALGYVLISALVILNIEPETFDNYFDAVYWATVSLTTMGYGDIYPVTKAGKFITMLSSVFGVAIIALPASIITAGMMEEVDDKNK